MFCMQNLSSSAFWGDFCALLSRESGRRRDRQGRGQPPLRVRAADALPKAKGQHGSENSRCHATPSGPPLAHRPQAPSPDPAAKLLCTLVPPVPDAGIRRVNLDQKEQGLFLNMAEYSWHRAQVPLSPALILTTHLGPHLSLCLLQPDPHGATLPTALHQNEFRGLRKAAFKNSQKSG